MRNHHYWNDAATHLDGVRYLLIPDENAELARYRGGELQVTFVVPRGQFDWVKANLAGQLHVHPQLTTYYYGFNLRRPPFRDSPQLRRALSLVIDREKLAQLVLRVGELPAYGWVPPGVDNYSSQSFDYAQQPMAERIREARQLYAQAGYSKDKPLSFELRYNTGEVHTKLAVAIASMWKEALGADVHLAQAEFKSLLQDIDRGDVEMFRSSWVGDYNDAYTFAQYLKSDFGMNLPHYRSAAYDALLAQAAERGGPGEAARAAGAGRAGDAQGSPAAADLLLRQQAPGEAGGAGLVRQRDERGLQPRPEPGRPRALTTCRCRTRRRSAPADRRW